MGFFDLFRPKSRRKFNVAAEAVSVTGALHKADGVPNQDTSFTMLWPRKRLASRKGAPGQASCDGIFVVGVFDGHGDEGHTASALACTLAQESLTRLFLSDYKDGKMEDYLRLVFELMGNRLDKDPCSDDSGTTATIAIVYDSEVTVGHVGDSCGILISSKTGYSRPSARHVTPMHRTLYPTEAARIERAGGLIMDSYVVDKETKRKGISVTRTLGDRDMHKNGCISVPEIQTLRLEPSDIAIIVATDGLWDVEGFVVRDVLTAAQEQDPQVINQLLMNQATESGPADDCTIATLTFHPVV